MPKLLKNTIVQVYEDHRICEKPLGQAKLLEYIRTNKVGVGTDLEVEFWTVRFIGNRQKSDRLINVKKH